MRTGTHISKMSIPRPMILKNVASWRFGDALAAKIQMEVKMSRQTDSATSAER